MVERGTALPRVVLVGWGAIARTVAQHAGSFIDLVGVAVGHVDRPRPDLPAHVTRLIAPDALAAVRPDVVVEAAGRDAVVPWGAAALATGADLAVSSVSAFADPDVLAMLRQEAVANGAQIHISAGALAGVDALAAARVLGLDEVEHRIVKPPAAWRGTPAEELCDLAGLSTRTAFHQASAAVTARRFPKNANVAMTTALAGIGPDQTVITLVADPATDTNRHEISASGAFGRLAVAIDNAPLPENPKSSAMAALSLVRSLHNRTSAIVV